MQRGQQAAPFALLLAVAVLAVMIPVTFNLVNQYQTDQARSEMQNKLSTFAREIELAATLATGKKVISQDLMVFGTGGFTVETIKIETPDEEDCVDYCHVPNCRYLLASYTDYTFDPPQEELAFEPVCIKLPLTLELNTKSCSAPSKPMSTSFKPGVYEIIAEKKGFTLYLCQNDR